MADCWRRCVRSGDFFQFTNSRHSLLGVLVLRLERKSRICVYVPEIAARHAVFRTVCRCVSSAWVWRNWAPVATMESQSLPSPNWIQGNQTNGGEGSLLVPSSQFLSSEDCSGLVRMRSSGGSIVSPDGKLSFYFYSWEKTDDTHHHHEENEIRKSILEQKEKGAEWGNAIKP